MHKIKPTLEPNSDRHVMPLPHIFKEGMRVNQIMYQSILIITVMPWIEEVAAEGPCLIHKDAAESGS